MRVTVVQGTASAADIAGYQPLQPMSPDTLTRPAPTVVLARRSSGSGVQPRRRTPVQPLVTALSLGDTSMATVVRPSRHSVGGGPRARPATMTA
ncbi:MAG: hypothetical protein QOF82_1559 [Frankiales bacterium]|nr:hypothetical protein [Frankiales bacterium]